MWALLGAASFALAVIASYETVPSTNTAATAFDTIIVLGSPADPNGQPSSEQRERVLAAIGEYRAGRSQHMILSGGPTFGGSTEAEVMALVARGEGLTRDVILVEPRARNTIENIFYCNQVMRQHGWHSAEIVSSPSHLPRAALILEHYPIEWRVQSSHWPADYTSRRIGARYLHETLGTAALRWFGFRPSPFLPTR